jgi:hypothetical protein
LSGAQCCEGRSAFIFKGSTIQEECYLVGATDWAYSHPFQPEISSENAVCGVLCFNHIQDKVQLERHCSGSGCNDSISSDCDCIIGGGGGGGRSTLSLNFRTTFCVYNVTGSMDLQMMGVSSRSCINRSEAQVGELLFYSDNKRACSVFPQVCCTQTINVPIQCSSGMLLYSDNKCACSLFSQVVSLVTWTLTISLLFIWPYYEYTPQPNLVLAAVYLFIYFYVYRNS